MGQVLQFPERASEPKQEKQEEAKAEALGKLKSKIEAAKQMYLKLL